VTGTEGFRRWGFVEKRVNLSGIVPRKSAQASVSPATEDLFETRQTFAVSKGLKGAINASLDDERDIPVWSPTDDVSHHSAARVWGFFAGISATQWDLRGLPGLWQAVCLRLEIDAYR
jgi:hypothetical protein